MRIVADSINEGWYRLLLQLMDGAGENMHKSAPRGMETREILGAQLYLRDPAMCIVGYPARRLNYTFMCAEALWLSMGLNRVDLIRPYNHSLGKFAADPGASHFQGAYGPRIIDQIDYVVDTLTKDPDSRQAIISIWRPRPRASADIACTISMQFFNRDDHLHMHTYMRSQDIWLGTPYDIFTFTFIQSLVAYRLDLDAGSYTHTMGSLHLYERDFGGARRVLDSKNTGLVSTPRTPISDAPIATVMALYTELTAIAPGFAFEVARVRFVRDWWGRCLDYLGGSQPWTNMLAVCAHRFDPGLRKFDDGWAKLIEVGR